MRSQQEVLKEISTPESGKKRYRDSYAKLLAMRSPFAAEVAYENRAKRRIEFPLCAKDLTEDFNREDLSATITTTTDTSVAPGIRMRRV